MSAEVTLGTVDEIPKGIVAQLRMPVPVRNIGKMVTYLEQAYGKPLFMYQDREWLIFTNEERT